MPLELGLDVGLVVLELEARRARRDLRRIRLGPLGREREDALLVGGLERVAVGDVQLGAEVRVEAVGGGVPLAGLLVERLVGDARLDVIAGERGEDAVVGRLRVLLVAERIQQQLRRGVVVLLEREVDPLPELQHRLGLGLRGRAGAAVGLVVRVVRGALVVTTPVDGVVAVRVDAVARLAEHAVAVVVRHVLAPQAVALGERVLVAVRVGDAERTTAHASPRAA